MVFIGATGSLLALRAVLDVRIVLLACVIIGLLAFASPCSAGLLAGFAVLLGLRILLDCLLAACCLASSLQEEAVISCWSITGGFIFAHDIDNQSFCVHY